MLTGALSLTECHSSRAVWVQLRPLPTTSFRFQTRTTSLLPLTNIQCARSFGNIASSFPGAKFGPRSQLTFREAHLSTTIYSPVRLRRTKAQFLKPRKRPEFRLRTEEENDELVLEALEESQKEYDSHVKGRAGHALYNTSEPARSWQPFAAGNESVPAFSTDTRQSPGKGSQLTSGTRLPRKEALTASLEHELHYLAHNDPNPMAIHNILKILISDRGLVPNVHHYEALILANTWPDYGSVSNVEKILSEMDSAEVEIGTSIVAAVLKVLAIHPSPELSHKMLLMMERRWIQLSPQMHHHLVLAMIRTGQTELASWTLDVLRSKHTRTASASEAPPDYLVVLLITEMVKLGDWEGVLRYVYKLRKRRAADRDIPIRLWSWLLDRASTAARKLIGKAQLQPVSTVLDSDGSNATSEGRLDLSVNMSHKSTYHQNQVALSNPAKYLTEFLWSFYVTPMSIQPSFSTCYTILRLAANTGTLWLAESVFTVMTYLNGIDESGHPKNKITDGVRALLKVAQEKAALQEDERIRSEGKDPTVERKKERDAEKKRVAKEAEFKTWWAELMAKFDEEEQQRETEGDQSKQDSHNPETTTNEKVYDSASRIAKHEADPQTTTTTQPESEVDPSKDEFRDEESSPKPFRLLDLSTAPPGNLWPLFPEIDGVGTGHVDPWEALGPKSASNRQWTEAQRHFGQISRQQRAEKKKG